MSKGQHDVHMGWGFLYSHQTDGIQISTETVLTTKTLKTSPVIIQKTEMSVAFPLVERPLL